MSTAAVAVKERPILFSGPMVRAILEGQKTQTRRVVKGLPEGIKCASAIPESNYQYRFTDFRYHTIDLRCPYGRPQLPLEPPRDRLWVRETWQAYRANSAEQEAVVKCSLERLERGEVKDIVAEVRDWPIHGEGEKRVLYAADFGEWAYDVDSDLKPWRPSIFMPRWASRLTLEITDVRVERLQEITPQDVLAEGILHPVTCNSGLAKYPNGVPAGVCADRNCDCRVFRDGWDSINDKRKGCAWSDNPWVWVIEFKKL